MIEVQLSAIAGVFKACASVLRKMASKESLDGQETTVIEVAAMVEAAAAKLEQQVARSRQ